MISAKAIIRERKRVTEIREKLRDGRETYRVRPGRLEGAALRISIACPGDWLAVVDEYAERRDVSRSVLIREAALFGIDRWLEEDDARRAAEPMLDEDSTLDALDAVPGRIPAGE